MISTALTSVIRSYCCSQVSSRCLPDVPDETDETTATQRVYSQGCGWCCTICDGECCDECVGVDSRKGGCSACLSRVLDPRELCWSFFLLWECAPPFLLLPFICWRLAAAANALALWHFNPTAADKHVVLGSYVYACLWSCAAGIAYEYIFTPRYLLITAEREALEADWAHYAELERQRRAARARRKHSGAVAAQALLAMRNDGGASTGGGGSRAVTRKDRSDLGVMNSSDDSDDDGGAPVLYSDPVLSYLWTVGSATSARVSASVSQSVAQAG